MSSIRVLHVLHGLDRGGIETFIMNVYRKIDRSKVQFDFAIVKKDKCEYEDEILSLGGRIYRMPSMSIKSIVQFNEKFGALCRNYKIVHSHWNTISTIVLNVAKRNNVKYRIAHSHIAKFSSGVQGLMKRFLRVFINSFSTHQFACGADAGAFLYGRKVVNKSSFKIINNGIELERFLFNAQIRNKIRENRGVTDDTLVVGHVGRMGEQKNQTFAVEVFAEIVKKRPDAQMWFIGTGPEANINLVKEKAKELGVHDKISFLGSIPNVNEYLNAFDIYLFPSLYEGLSVALIEAQTAGLMCYTSDTIDVNSKVTENVIFNSLAESPVVWAERILDGCNYERKNMEENMTRAGYNIIDTAKWLQEFYLSLT